MQAFIHAMAGLVLGLLGFLSAQISFHASTTPPAKPADFGYVDFSAKKSPEALASSGSRPPPSAALPTVALSAATSTSKTKPHVVAEPATQPAAAQLPAIDQDALQQQARAAVVNIFCNVASSGSFDPLSGSGVVVDSRGVILTNAHVGQFFLLRDWPSANNVDCIVRTGSPAQAMYRASLLYLPPAWIDANASKITERSPTGTGEDDYAFLLITSSANSGAPLPSSFPYLPMSAQEPNVGDHMLLTAYPAGFLEGIQLQSNLYATAAYAAVQGLFSFGSLAHVDLFSVGGTVVSQSGASGGAAVSTLDGKLVGIISTDTSSPTTAGRDLRAITLAHINRSLAAVGVGGVADLLVRDAVQSVADFAATLFPAEKQKLVDVLENR